MRALVFAFCVFSCAFLHADTFTWNGGGGANNNWSEGNNWSGNAPATDGSASLIFAGGSATTANNDFFAGTAFAGITLNNTAGFTLNGNAIMLAGPLVSATATAEFTDTVSLPITLTANTALTANNLHHVTFTGIISGPHGLTKNGGGNITLNGANTYTGPTAISGGRVFFNSLRNLEEACSFGAPLTQEAGRITVNATFEYRGGEMASNRDLWFPANATFSHGGSGPLTLNGGIGGGGAPFIRGSGHLIFNGPVTNTASFDRTDPGTLSLYYPANTFPGFLNIYDGWVNVSNIANSGVVSPIGTGNRITFGQDGWDTTGGLRYFGDADASCNRALYIQSSRCSHGCNLQIANPNATVTFNGTVTTRLGSATPVDSAIPLWLSGDGKGVLASDLPAGLRIIKTGNGTWTLSGANSHTGRTEVTAGTLLINGSTAAASAVSVSAGTTTLGGTGTVHGALSVSANGTLAPGLSGCPGTFSAASASFNSARLIFDLQDPGDGPSDKIAIAGHVDFSGTSTLTLNLPSGGLPGGLYPLITYASCLGVPSLAQAYPNTVLITDSTNVALRVFDAGTVSELVWRGSESAEWDLGTANWSPSEILFANDLSVVFDDSTSVLNVIIPGPIEPSRVTVATTNNLYTLSATGTAGLSGSASLAKSGPAELTLAGNHSHAGLTSISQSTLTLTNGTLTSSSISIATNANLNQTADSVIAGAGVSLTIQGTASLRGANTYGGETFVGAFGIYNRNTTLYHNEALGSTSGGTTIIGGDGSLHNSLFLAPGVTVTNETLTIAGNGRASLAFPSAGSATWDGDIIAASGASYINCNQRGGTLYIGAPGTAATISGGNQIQFREDGTIVLNSRINLPGQQIVRDNTGTLVINSTNNVFARVRVAEGTVRLGADNALPPTVILDMGKGDANAGNKAYFDLDGHHQTITNIVEAHHDAFTGTDIGRQYITSALPATLTANIPVGATVNFIRRGSEIHGAVTLVKDGPGTLTLGQTNLTSGAFIVSNGVLRLSTGSAGPDCTNVTVAAGTLKLENPDALMPAANVTFPAGSPGTIDIAAGVNVTVSTLWFGESQKRAGTWGAPGGGAQNTDPRFTGGGTLTVRHDTGGTLFMLQ